MTDTIETQSIPRIRTANRDWAEAITLWLSTRKSLATRRAYAKALEDLLVSSNAMPWEITRTHMLRWVQELSKSGHAATTITQRLAGISSFYRFTMEEYFIESPSFPLQEGGQKQTRPLHDNNPAIGKTLRPPVEMYGKSTWLDADEAKALLSAIYQGSLQGARDYALFLGYMMLARRNSEWRQAKWGDFERHGEQVIYRWDGKGKKDQRIDVPMPVWFAVCDYLQKGGRLDSIQVEEYIFTAISRQNMPLPNGKTIQENRPICSHEVGRLLKRYLRMAGLQGKSIRVHSLRHTGALLMESAGASNREIMEYLGHGNLATTQVYLHKLKGNRNSHWMLVSELLGLERPAPMNCPSPNLSPRGRGRIIVR